MSKRSLSRRSLSLCCALLSAQLASACAELDGESAGQLEDNDAYDCDLAGASQALTKSLVLQPGPEGKDARVFSIASQRNKAGGGSTNKFLAMAWTWSGEPGVVRSFIDFTDLAQIPPDATINKATLKLFAELTPGVNQLGHSQLTGTNEIFVSRVTSPWGEDTVTWNNQPSIDKTDQIALPKSTSNAQNYAIDVTGFVKKRVADPAHNFGMAIQLKTEQFYRAVHFGSSDHTNAAIRPRLEVEYSVPDPVVCDVLPEQELMITDLSVVEDPVRTGPSGVWSFGKLMEDMAPTPAAAPLFVRHWIESWRSDQMVSNGRVVPQRAALADMILAEWPTLPSGELDLSRAPFRLLAVVNRPDLRNTAAGKAGEGRFVFGFIQNGQPAQFAVILEYRLPGSSANDVVAWAKHWHELRSLPFPSAQYNDKLEEITRAFAGRNAEPGAPNGNAISQVRTNELTVQFPWELREWVLDSTGFLQPDTVKGTPPTELSSVERQALVSFLNANEAAVLAGTHVLPPELVAASSRNNLSDWTGLTGVNDESVRHAFAISTCNGCHGSEAQSGFLQIQNRSLGQKAALSQFLVGSTFNDLGRRKVDLESLICPSQPLQAPAARLGADGEEQPVAPSAPSVNFELGIGRVH